MSLVYFIQAGCAIKIGHTADIKRRIKNLQSSNHIPLKILLEIPTPDIKSARQLEKNLHVWFRTYHINCEWFRDCGVIRSVIKEIQDNNIETALKALRVAHKFFTKEKQCG